jgi:transposase InsO family protein
VSRFEFIEEHRDVYPLELLLDVLKVSRSGFYAWKDRPDSATVCRRRTIVEAIAKVREDENEIPGSRKVTAALIENGIAVCRNTVARLMRENDWKSRVNRRRGFVVTTRSNPGDAVAPNVLDRDFSASAPDRKWVSDITYVPTNEGWAYLAVVLDLFSRRVVGWSMSESLSTELVLDALNSAIKTRKPDAGLVHHSDRGCQYTSAAHRTRLAQVGIECSMSRRGNCWDNACAERFFCSYKTEWVKHESYATVEDARVSAFEYIEIYYNRTRRHEALEYISPVAFEERAEHAGAA